MIEAVDETQFTINVRPIENGYLVEKHPYYSGKTESWYCISPEEITEKLMKLL